jgi:1-acyl-sn-glycerol-3-phosphate acyltransferase
MWYRLNRLFFRVLLARLLDYRIEGAHHEPAAPFLIIANHTSALDDPLVGLVVRAPLVYIGKEELLRPWVVGLWVRSLGSIFIRRGEPDRAALEAALQALRRGRAVSIFPEGTRSVDGRLGTFHHGAAWLALHTGVPVLPVGIAGAYAAMPRGARWPQYGTVVVRAGPPIWVPREERVTRRMMGEWTDRFRRAVIDLLPLHQHPRPLPRPAAGDAVTAGRSAAGVSADG